MTDGVVTTPGTLVQMRTLRRFHHYSAGEIIAVPMAAAQDLAARRLAQPLQLLVPGPVAAAAAEPATRPAPAAVVRK
jgi:hypothetical protein